MKVSKWFDVGIVVFMALCLVLGAMVLLPGPGDVLADNEDGTRDVITPTTVLNTGVTQTLAAASGDGHEFPNGGKTFVVITNNYTDTVVATFVTGGSVGGLAIADVDVTVADGATKIVGPFVPGIFNQTSGADRGDVYINFDAAVTGTVANSVTLAAYTLE